MAAAEGMDMPGCPDSLNAFAKTTLDCTVIGAPLTYYANLASHAYASLPAVPAQASHHYQNGADAAFTNGGGAI